MNHASSIRVIVEPGLIAWLFSGCSLGLTFLEESPGDSNRLDSFTEPVDTGTPTGNLDTIEITSVLPDFGTTAGGLAVTITGGIFDDSAQVLFGGQEATILSLESENELRVLTPAQSTEGYVTIGIRTDSGFGSLDSAFRYFKDHAGETGAMGEFHWYHYIGDYWQNRPPDGGFAYFAFLDPVSLDPWEIFGPTTEDCAVDYSAATSLSSIIQDVPVATLNAPNGSSVTLPWNSTYFVFYNQALTDSEYYFGVTYNLAEFSSSSYPSFHVDDFVTTPDAAGFQIISPALAGSDALQLSKYELQFSWTGSHGDRLLLMLALWNSEGTDYETTVSCLVPDTGSFTVPSAVWPSYPTGRQITVYATSMTMSDAVVPFNGASVGIAGEYALIGAFFTQLTGTVYCSSVFPWTC